MSLEEAQEAKKRHIAAKLDLRPGHRVLDIGCGFGGMALFLARNYGVHVTGVTLSTEQLKIARERAAKQGLTRLVDFRLEDYRRTRGPFDRIVSVGMFEHVGRPHYGQFFSRLNALLADDGVALLHTIGRQQPPSPINVWMRQNIFPGAYLPSLSQLAPVLEKQDLLARRLREPAPALRHDAQGVEPALPAQPRAGARSSILCATTTASAACGNSICRPARPASATAA